MSEVKLPERDRLTFSSLEYPSNAKLHKDETEEKKEIHKIISGTVTMQKKPFGKRFKEAFFGDRAQDMKGYILTDVIVPTIRDTIWAAGSGALEILLYGEVRSRKRGYGRPWDFPLSRNSSFSDAYRSYDAYYGYGATRKDSLKNGKREPEPARRSRSRQNVKDIRFSSRTDAKEVLDQLCELIDTDGYAGVRDLYAMIGEDANFVDEYWGWTDLSTAVIVPINGGYLLDLPKAVPVK